ncbi:MAG TPA: outer membrane beta-barrel protein [Nitrospira sp.]|nr:outer membrane beta-barrel protein [Nitrospira sp.]
MNTVRTIKAALGISLFAIALQAILSPSMTQAESYVAGQFGVTFPQSLSGGKTTQDSIGGLDISDQPLKSSVNLGAKLGHYFSRAKWIGIETGLSYTTPHIKEGSLTFTGPGGSLSSGTLSGVHQRIIIWDVVTLMLRYPGKRLQPYVGVGPALFFASLKGPTAPPGQSATAIGLNAEAGVRYFMTRHWALFGEGTYHRARLGYISNDSNPAADPFGFRATYSALSLSLGISYHF